MNAPAVYDAEAILTYWFSGTDDEQKTRHWKGLKETDDEIREKFFYTCEALSDKDTTLAGRGWTSFGPGSHHCGESLSPPPSSTTSMPK